MDHFHDDDGRDRFGQPHYGHLRPLPSIHPLVCPQHGENVGEAQPNPGDDGASYLCGRCGEVLFPQTELDTPPTRPFEDGRYYVTWEADGDARWTVCEVRDRNKIAFLGRGPSHDEPTARYTRLYRSQLDVTRPLR